MTDSFIFLSALREFLRFKRVVVWLLVIAGLMLMARLFITVNRGVDSGEAYSMLSTLFVFRLLPLASAIFSTAVLAQEVEQKTIVYLLTRPVSRARLLLLRTLGSATVVALLSVLSAVAVAFVVYGNSNAFNRVLAQDLIAICVGAVAYATLFVLVSLWANRAMIINLLFAFAWETSVINMPGSMHLLSVSSYLTAIAQRPSAGQATDMPMGSIAANLGTNLLSRQTGWIVSIGIILVCGALCAFWFSKFEYLPREDAE